MYRKWARLVTARLRVYNPAHLWGSRGEGRVGKVHYALMLLAALVAMWLCLSLVSVETLFFGGEHGLVVFLGAASVVLVIVLVERMGLMDGETAPYNRMATALFYWIWLGGEIVKANIEVSRAILKADLDITPRLLRVPARQRTALGRATFANSITLTPGTVTVDVDGDDLIVHTLLDSMADPAGFADMHDRSQRAMEGRER